MAVHTEDLRQQLLPEAVHYRHDDDEGGDADGDAEHREGGDDGDEALLPARAEIAQGDEALESGNEHSDGLASQRSEEHTSELQSLMRNTYDVFCLKKKIKQLTYKSSHDAKT